MTEGIKKTRVLVDTDPNMWLPRRDIDDALALLFLIASPEVEIRGITVNFGNVSAPVGYAAARELLDRVGLSVPLFKGAESKHDLGKKSEAIEFLIQTVKDAPGEITLLALAPLTNMAGAMLLDDTFAQNPGGLMPHPFLQTIPRHKAHAMPMFPVPSPQTDSWTSSCPD